MQIFTLIQISVALVEAQTTQVPATQFMVVLMELLAAILFTAAQMAIQTLIQFTVVPMAVVVPVPPIRLQIGKFTKKQVFIPDQARKVNQNPQFARP